MFLTDIVLGLLEDHPGATVDEILPECEGHDREQVFAALHWMAHKKRVRCDRQPGLGVAVGGSLPGRYYALEPAKPRAEKQCPRVSSVWDLGSRT